MGINQIIKKYKITNFIKAIKAHLSEYNGKIIFKSEILNNGSSDGEFSEMEMSIKCSINSRSTYWIGVLAHEYCHFLQCVEDNEFWLEFQSMLSENLNDIEDIFSEETKKTTKRVRKKIANSIIRMELDCDEATLKLIKKWKLPVDVNEYICKSNIILYKYMYWGEYGIWPDLIDKKTGKNLHWKSFNLKKFGTFDKYTKIQNMPKKLFYSFSSRK